MIEQQNFKLHADDAYVCTLTDDDQWYVQIAREYQLMNKHVLIPWYMVRRGSSHDPVSINMVPSAENRDAIHVREHTVVTFYYATVEEIMTAEQN